MIYEYIYNLCIYLYIVYVYIQITLLKRLTFLFLVPFGDQTKRPEGAILYQTHSSQ